MSDQPTTEEIFRPFFQTLPEGMSVWPEKQRQAWLDGMRALFDLVYRKPDPLRIELVHVLIGKLQELPTTSNEFKALCDEIQEHIANVNAPLPMTGKAT